MTTKDDNIKGLVCAYDNAQIVMYNAVKAMCEGAFRNRDMYVIPTPLRKALENCGNVPASIFLCYQHHIENVDLWGVQKADDYSFNVYGIKGNGYYRNNIEGDYCTDDIEQCARFLQWYFENDWDTKINRFYDLMLGVEDTDACCNAIKLWNDEFNMCIDPDDLIFDDLMCWVYQFKRIENK